MSDTAADTSIPAEPGIFSTLISEWRKARALRSTLVGVTVILLLGAGVGAFIALVGDGSAIAEAQAENEYSVVFYSSSLSTWVFAFLAASLLASEFGGMGEATFVATARRGRVLAAKLVLVAAGGLIVGLLASVVAVAATQGVLADRGIELLDLTDPVLARAVVLFMGASMAVHGVLAACIAVFTRSAAGAVAATGLMTLAPINLAQFLGQWYASTVPRWMPGAAVESVAGLSAPGSYVYLSAPASAVCLVVWIAVFCTLAALRLPRIDIR